MVDRGPRGRTGLQRSVVAVMGDGSYLFGAPAATHWVARKMDLPVLFLVWNNAKWGAVEGATRMVYPHGWAVRTGSFPFSDLSPSLDYELLCQAAGGHGERVEDPAELPAALEREVAMLRRRLDLLAAPAGLAEPSAAFDDRGVPLPAVVPAPSALTHSANVPRVIPRSAAMPFNVAPGVDSYRSTACRRNSSE